MDSNNEPEPADPIAKVLRLAGPRPPVGAERAARVRSAVHDAWRADVRMRSRRRAVVGFAATAGLAAAAALIVGIWVREPSRDPVRPTTTLAARVLSVSGDVRLSTATDGRADGSAVHQGDTIPAGAIVIGSPSGTASFALEGGGELRVDANTRLTLAAEREISLVGGALYIDSGGGAPVAVRTPVGLVRDIGTRFEVRRVGDTWRTRVRDGAIRFEAPTGSRDATAGRELVVEPGGGIVERAVAPYGAEWDWITKAAPVFRIEGNTLSAFLDWAAHEGGRPIRFADQAVARTTAGITLHGSIEGLSVDEALAVVLPTCGLVHAPAGEAIVVRRP